LREKLRKSKVEEKEDPYVYGKKENGFFKKGDL